MKKFFTLIAAFVVALSVSAQDEEIDNTYQFIDHNGNVVAHGSTVEGIVEENPFPGPDDLPYWVVSGLSVRCTDDSWKTDDKLYIQGNIIQMPSGVFQCCFPAVCAIVETTGPFTTTAGQMMVQEMPIATEWAPKSDGLTIVELQIVNASGFVTKNGPKVTVNFNYSDPTGINDAQAGSNKTVVARYTMDGQQIAAPQKGINILKMSDGTTKKVVVKE